MYVPARVIRKRYSLSYSCLRNWALKGKVDYRQTPGGVRLYSEDDIKNVFKGPTEDTNEKENIIYARVSSSHQKEDLERQVQDLHSKYPNHRIIKDIGSGLNFERKGLQTLLDLIFNGSIKEIVVAYKDRLCRFGFELFEALCRRFEVRLVVLNREKTGSERELSEDLLAIINFFVARNNGRRAGQNRKRRRANEEHQASNSTPEDQNISIEANQTTKSDTETVVRSVPVDIQSVC